MTDAKYRNAAGQPVPRVSEVLDTWNEGNEALMDWAARIGPSHTDVRDEAGNIGTLCHALIESELTGGPSPLVGHPLERITSAQKAFEGWKRWRNSVVLTKHEGIEVQGISEMMQVGGTLDYVGIVGGAMGGRRMLIDWKTSNQLRRRYIVQVEAYGAIWNEKHPDKPLDGGKMIVRCDKRTGNYEVFHWHHDAAALQMFHMLRQVYWFGSLIGDPNIARPVIVRDATVPF